MPFGSSYIDFGVRKQSQQIVKFAKITFFHGPNNFQPRIACLQYCEYLDQTKVHSTWKFLNKGNVKTS